MACHDCFNELGLSRFLKEEHPVDAESDDALRAKKTLRFSKGHNGGIQPSFYGGAAFDSSLVRNNARAYANAVSMLRSQSRTEKH